jgi:glycosyltransferase involved in cell wall biosynthesis
VNDNAILLTIAIPTYNRAPILDRSLCIIQSQLKAVGGCVEFIVSDNCSTDDTRGVINRYIDSGMPINYIKNDVNIGSSLNIVKCYRMARGKYVWVLGDDDYLTDNAIEFVIKLLQKNRDYGLLFHSLYSGNSVQYREYHNKKRFFSTLDFMILWISGNILRKCYIDSFPFEKYVTEEKVNWNASVFLNIHAMTEADYNVRVYKKIFISTGIDSKKSGVGYDLFKVETNFLELIKTKNKELGVNFIFYEKLKYLLFSKFLAGVIELYIFQKQKGNWRIKGAFIFLFRYYWYLPYMYVYLVRWIIKYRL